jgi:hypothetical protein
MKGDWSSRLWRFVRRLDLGAALILALLILVAIGSLLPQRPDAGARVWLELFDWYASPLFLLAVGMLGLATLACTLGRWRRVWRRALPGHPQRGAPATDSSRWKADLPGGDAANWLPLLEQELPPRGYRPHTRRSIEGVVVRADRNQLAHLGTLATHLALLALLLGALWNGLSGWSETVQLKPGKREALGPHGEVEVSTTGPTLRYDPDGRPAGYAAQVTLQRGAARAVTGPVAVNQPLSYRGAAVFLRSYVANESEGAGVELLLVHAPGNSLLLLAGGLLMLGVAVSLSLPPRSLTFRFPASETEPACVTGQPGRQAWRFEREFTMLVADLRAAHAREMGRER